MGTKEHDRIETSLYKNSEDLKLYWLICCGLLNIVTIKANRYWEKLMRQYLVAVINGTKARFFSLKPVELKGYEAGPNLVEHESLLSIEKEMQGQDLWANTKTGRNRGTSGQAHSYNDHRNNHMVEFEKRFAHSIAGRIADLSKIYEAQQLILVAEPQILGLMREVMSSGLPRQMTLQELAKDLCRLSPKELHDYLAERSLLPAFKRMRI